MPQLVEVRFKGNRKAFFEWLESEPLRVSEPVIVESDRGLDFGRVSAIGAVAKLKCERCGSCAVAQGDLAPTGANEGDRRRPEATRGDRRGHEGGSESARRPPEPTRKVVRRATAADSRTHESLRAQEDDVRRKVRDKVAGHNLAMKVSDAEWQWDRGKLTIYFTAEKRVDFRALVRDLASMFRSRIELRQFGVRDEAARLSGIGRCGRELCSASWLPELRPIGLHVAKDQRLSLNPTQISGPCGRLLCCLRYEHEFYVQSRKRFPKEGKVLQTARGLEKVYSLDIFRDRVSLRSEDGSLRTVELAVLREELAKGTEGTKGTEGRGAEVTRGTKGEGTKVTEAPSVPASSVSSTSVPPVSSVPFRPSPSSPPSPESVPPFPKKKRRRRRRRRGGDSAGGDTGGAP